MPEKKQSPLLWGGLLGLVWLLSGEKKTAAPPLYYTPPQLEPQIPPTEQTPANPANVMIPPGGFILPGSGIVILTGGGNVGTAQTIGFLGQDTGKPPKKELTSTQFFFYLDKYPELIKGGLQMSIDSYPTYHALATMLAIVMLDMVSPTQNIQIASMRQFFTTSQFFFSQGMLELIADPIVEMLGYKYRWMEYPKTIAAPVIENRTTGQERIYRGTSKEFVLTYGLGNACKEGYSDFGFLLELSTIRAGQILVLQSINPEAAKAELAKAQGTIGTVAKVVGMAASKVPGAGVLIQVVAGLIEGIAAIWKAGETQAKLENATVQASSILEAPLSFFNHRYSDLPSRRMQVLIEGTNSYFNKSQIWRTICNIEPYVATRTGVLQMPYFYHKIPWSIPYVLDARLKTCLNGLAFIGPYGGIKGMHPLSDCNWTANPTLERST